MLNDESLKVNVLIPRKKSTLYIPWVNGGSSCGWSSEVVADKAMEGTIGLCTA